MAYYVTPTNERMDPPRREKRLLLRIECGPLAQIIPPGVRLQHGTNEVVVYASELPRIEAQVEDETSMIEVANRTLRNEFDRWLRDKLPDDEYRSLKDSGREHSELNWRTYGGSFEACFNRVVGRDIRPLRKVELLAEVPPAPRQPEHPESVIGPWSTVASYLDDESFAYVDKQLSGGKSSGSKKQAG